MKRVICQVAVFLTIIAGGLVPAGRAQHLDQIGATLLWAVTTNLNGAGIPVAQPEASVSLDQPIWEVNPASVHQPVSLFTYISEAGSTNAFPNSLSAESGHANYVARLFYGNPGGVATNVAHVDNYEANFFISNYVSNLTPMPGTLEVNQSFSYGSLSVSNQQQVDSTFDDYSETFGTLFVSAACNASISVSVCAPGTSYNCICVAAYGGDSSVGPTIDNGRCKPDITAPEGATSFSTPQVSGAATVLLQAALRGDGGGSTNFASDMRTIKALLLNGAVKPANWTNSNSSPLDARYGTGVLNVFNAYEQLAGGKQAYVATTSVTLHEPHPPTGDAGSISVLSGWDFNTNSSSATTDGVNHYYFNLTNSFNGADFTATATLAWNRQLGESNINNLDLFLFNVANSNLVACSTSRVDNVEHIWLPQLAPGRYDLQVLKNGGTKVVSDAEAYALAFEFYSQSLSFSLSGANILLTWPVYPAGFVVETANNLASTVWAPVPNATMFVTNQQNRLLVNPTNSSQFFRLRLP